MTRFHFASLALALQVLLLVSTAAPAKTALSTATASTKHTKRVLVQVMAQHDDEASYQARGILKSQFSGVNRFTGNTFSIVKETLAVEFNDALFGFLSFDKLGTLRERIVYRANGTSETRLYDARTGDITQTKTDAVHPGAAIVAGGMVVMPGDTFAKLLDSASVAPARNKIYITTNGIVPSVNLLIAPALP